MKNRLAVRTFTIVQVYDDGRLPFYHFDVYRIGDIEEMDEIGFEDYVYGDGVSLIEWANLIDEILPANRTEITIEKDLEQGFDFRRITVEKEENNMRILAVDSSGTCGDCRSSRRRMDEDCQVPSQSIRSIIRRHIHRPYCRCWMRSRT